ncbi:MAG: GNAT family N-acetyltransferase [Methanohalobium sp.]|uniref:GNAT family N-acetyltransferase n=1 Tax=Methanohalobium sp. TaxID=2837493 RepID=UPI0039791299
MIVKTCNRYQNNQIKNLIMDVLSEHGFEYDPEKDYDLEDIKQYYLNDGSVFYTGIVDGKIIGTGAVKRIDNDRCEIKRIYIKKGFRNKGYGTKLFDETLEFAKKHYKTATIKTDVALRKAVNLYLKKGFVITHLDTENKIVYLRKYFH